MKNSICCILVLSVFWLACTKPDTPPAEILNTSKVFVYDEGRALQTSLGATISIENVNPAVSTSANTLGEYQLRTPSKGDSITVVWAKTGYGIFKETIKSVNSSLVINDINLGAPSTVVVKSLSAIITADSVKLTVDISSPNLAGEKYIRLIARKNAAGISISSAVKADAGLYQVQNGINVFTIARLSFANDTPRAGDTIYTRAYGDSYYGNLYTERSGALVFPNLNPNTCPEATFVWP